MARLHHLNKENSLTMRKLAPWLAVLLFTTATAALASNGKYRGHSPKISLSDSGLTAPSSASAEQVVKGYLKRADKALSLTRQNAGKSGAKHVQLEQSIDGRPIYGAYVKASRRARPPDERHRQLRRRASGRAHVAQVRGRAVSSARAPVRQRRAAVVLSQSDGRRRRDSE
jgi:hypothetical protein